MLRNDSYLSGRKLAIKCRIASINSKNKILPANYDEVIFTYYLSALIAEIAPLADYNNIDDEIRNFTNIFNIDIVDNEIIKQFYGSLRVGKIHAQDAGFIAARLASYRFDPDANKKLFYNITVFLGRNKEFDNKKIEILQDIAYNMRQDKNYLIEILKKLLLPNKDNPYKILNVKKNEKELIIKRSYRKLLATCHPDKLIAKNMCDELKIIANSKFEIYSKAYEQIKLKRKFN